MGYVEDSAKDLFSYMPALTKRDDFDAFWKETLRHNQSVPLNATRTEISYPSPFIKVYDISFNGFDNTPIYGYFIVPTFIGADKYPCIVKYHGHTGNRGSISDHLRYAMLGVAVVSIDFRNQGGVTPDYSVYTDGEFFGTTAKGILDKNEYYFRRIYCDAISAIDFACQQPEVDADAIIIEGGSQGGAVTMAVAALDDRPIIALASVPSNSNLTERVRNANGSFCAVTDYLKKFPQHTDKALETLSYFDTMNMADRVKCDVYADVALRDTTCPAKCYFATYNRLNCKKHIEIIPFNGHEGGRPWIGERNLGIVKQKLASVGKLLV